MKIRKASLADLTNLCDFYQQVCEDQKTDQYSPDWHWGIYPSKEILANFLKNAQIIILDLKGKLKNLIYTEEETVSMDMLDDLILALEALGYNKKEIDKTLEKIDLSTFSSLEDAIKGILKNMRIGD